MADVLTCVNSLLIAAYLQVYVAALSKITAPLQPKKKPSVDERHYRNKPFWWSWFASPYKSILYLGLIHAKGGLKRNPAKAFCPLPTNCHICAMEKQQTALVTKHTGSHYRVRLDADGSYLECVVRGKLRLKDTKTTNPIAVGDRVDVEPNNDGQTGVIVNVHPRKNYLIRRSSNLSRQAHIVAANIDRAYLVASIAFPETKIEFIDRFLVSAEAYHIPVTILVNKVDLYEDELGEMIDEFEKTYTSIGYNVMRVSAHRGDNIDTLRQQLRNSVSVFSGNSGVGKSSIINAIEPSLEMRTGEISSYHLKGTHTTTFYEMVELPFGGFIIDTPGIKGFGLVDIEKVEISHYFPEIFRVSKGCKFNMCTHHHEPGCAVIDAVERGEISTSRYLSYLSMFEDDEGKYR